MNERIKELAELASKDNSDGYPVTLEYSNKFAERFAELIVRECVGIADEETSLPYNSYGEKIRKHFGVES